MYKPVTSGEFGDPSAGAASGRYSGPKGGRRASGHDSESGRFLDEESGGQREESSSFVIKTSRRAMLATGVLLAVCAITGVAVSSKKAQAKRLAQKDSYKEQNGKDAFKQKMTGEMKAVASPSLAPTEGNPYLPNVPTIAPSPATTKALEPTSFLDSCRDKDKGVVKATGFTCAELAEKGHCEEVFCPDCVYAHTCDDACGYCPTPAPTQEPPTPLPSSSPSLSPTVSPTPKTWKPTAVPASQPTPIPSSSPSLSPTVSPTPKTWKPTAVPASQPTPIPSAAPSLPPTLAPTPGTWKPTIAPTKAAGQPTPLPSAAPTFSEPPTFSPTPFCGDDEEGVMSSTGHNCLYFAKMGQGHCSSVFCNTCPFAHMCDRTCGLCPTYNGNPPNFKNEFLDENPPDTAGEALSPEDWLAEMKALVADQEAKMEKLEEVQAMEEAGIELEPTVTPLIT